MVYLAMEVPMFQYPYHVMGHLRCMDVTIVLQGLGDYVSLTLVYIALLQVSSHM